MGEVARSDTESERAGAEPIDIVLAPLAHSVPIARHAVQRLLDATFLIPPEVAADVLLLVSELVTNAVLHAGTAIRVSACADERSVMVAVGDDDPHNAPHRADRGMLAMSGRGMRLVELLASSWGVEVRETSKVVWFETAYQPEVIDLRSSLA